MFAICFVDGFDRWDHENSKYYGPYPDLETCIAAAPSIVRKCLKDINFEDQYGPDESEYNSEKDPADVVKEYDERHKNMFPYCAEKAMYGMYQGLVDKFYITEETLINMLREHKFYSPDNYRFQIVQFEKNQ